ncbi:MAG: hypothetical protein ABFD16_13780 [Thermoguttaceae bacterium]|jgi:hypothetical protein
MEVTDPTYFGTLTFGEPKIEELVRPGKPEKVTVTRGCGAWRPPERLASFFPEDFRVPIDCYTDPDGLRRIIPRCSLEELVELGAVGGLAVLHGVRDFGRRVDSSYRAMHLIHQIAQPKGKRGGRLHHEKVRQALLHLGWRAYQYVGQCVHVLMCAIKNSMPCPLNDEERQLFKRMHESQPCYGGMPLALLAERSSFLERAVLAI